MCRRTLSPPLKVKIDMAMLRRCVATPNSAADMRGMVGVRTVPAALDLSRASCGDGKGEGESGSKGNSEGKGEPESEGEGEGEALPPGTPAAQASAARGVGSSSLRGERETVAARPIAAGSVGPYSGLVLCDKEVTSVLSCPRQLLTLLHFW